MLAGGGYDGPDESERTLLGSARLAAVYEEQRQARLYGESMVSLMLGTGGGGGPAALPERVVDRCVELTSVVNYITRLPDYNVWYAGNRTIFKRLLARVLLHFFHKDDYAQWRPTIVALLGLPQCNDTQPLLVETCRRSGKTASTTIVMVLLALYGQVIGTTGAHDHLKVSVFGDKLTTAETLIRQTGTLAADVAIALKLDVGVDLTSRKLATFPRNKSRIICTMTACVLSANKNMRGADFHVGICDEFAFLNYAELGPYVTAGPKYTLVLVTTPPDRDQERFYATIKRWHADHTDVVPVCPECRASVATGGWRCIHAAQNYPTWTQFIATFRGLRSLSGLALYKEITEQMGVAVDKTTFMFSSEALAYIRTPAPASVLDSIVGVFTVVDPSGGVSSHLSMTTLGFTLGDRPRVYILGIDDVRPQDVSAEIMAVIVVTHIRLVLETVFPPGAGRRNVMFVPLFEANSGYTGVCGITEKLSVSWPSFRTRAHMNLVSQFSSVNSVYKATFNMTRDIKAEGFRMLVSAIAEQRLTTYENIVSTKITHYVRNSGLSVANSSMGTFASNVVDELIRQLWTYQPAERAPSRGVNRDDLVDTVVVALYACYRMRDTLQVPLSAPGLVRRVVAI